MEPFTYIRKLLALLWDKNIWVECVSYEIEATIDACLSAVDVRQVILKALKSEQTANVSEHKRRHKLIIIRWSRLICFVDLYVQWYVIKPEGGPGRKPSRETSALCRCQPPCFPRFRKFASHHVNCFCIKISVDVGSDLHSYVTQSDNCLSLKTETPSIFYNGQSRMLMIWHQFRGDDDISRDKRSYVFWRTGQRDHRPLHRDN